MVSKVLIVLAVACFIAPAFAYKCYSCNSDTLKADEEKKGACISGVFNDTVFVPAECAVGSVCGHDIWKSGEDDEIVVRSCRAKFDTENPCTVAGKTTDVVCHDCEVDSCNSASLNQLSFIGFSLLAIVYIVKAMYN